METDLLEDQFVFCLLDAGGRKGNKKLPPMGMIHTVKEDPNMPDSQVIVSRCLDRWKITIICILSLTLRKFL